MELAAFHILDKLVKELSQQCSQGLLCQHRQKFPIKNQAVEVCPLDWAHPCLGNALASQRAAVYLED